MAHRGGAGRRRGWGGGVVAAHENARAITGPGAGSGTFILAGRRFRGGSEPCVHRHRIPGRGHRGGASCRSFRDDSFPQQFSVGRKLITHFWDVNHFAKKSSGVGRRPAVGGTTRRRGMRRASVARASRPKKNMAFFPKEIAIASIASRIGLRRCTCADASRGVPERQPNASALACRKSPARGSKTRKCANFRHRRRHAARADATPETTPAASAAGRFGTCRVRRAADQSSPSISSEYSSGDSSSPSWSMSSGRTTIIQPSP